MNKLLLFVSAPQAFPETRAPEERKRDFKEIYGPFPPATTKTQASRCSQCGVPFCQIHCPLGNNIPDWLKLTAEGRLEEAYDVAAATNAFPEICGRICPQDKLCEGNCVIEKGFESVTIGAVEKYITENAFTMGWVRPPTPLRENGVSVGIIGAGPAGLTAADALRRKGYEVHVYDRYDRTGGLLTYGIPNFKLEKQVVERRTKLLEDAGIIFHLNVEIGKDVALDALRLRHTAVLIAVGVYKGRQSATPGRSLPGVRQALEYLTASNRVCLGDKVGDYEDGELNARDKHVVVIGGGDTAMDCVRTAVRQGARKVTCLYRRDRANMAGSAREVPFADEEGVEFLWLSMPVSFAGTHKVERILASRMRLGSPDADGRHTAKSIDGSEFMLDADMAIEALGFEAEDLPRAFDASGLSVSRWGTLH